MKGVRPGTGLCVRFVDDKTNEGVEVEVGRATTLEELKLACRAALGIAVADSASLPGQGLRLLYPPNGLPDDAASGCGGGALSASPAPLARGLSHGASLSPGSPGMLQRKGSVAREPIAHLTELRDEARWADAVLAFDRGHAGRRDSALVRHTSEAASLLRPPPMSPAQLASDYAPPPPLAALGAARRLSGIFGGEREPSSFAFLPPNYL